MASLWWNAGKLVVNAGGAAVWCDHCPCGGDPCCPGVTIPDDLFLTVSAVDLSLCPCLAGTFTLTRRVPTTGTVWNSPTFACDGTHVGLWGLRCNNSNNWDLFFVCDPPPLAANDPIIFATWADHCSPFTNNGNVNESLAGADSALCCPAGSGPPSVNFNWVLTT